MIESLNSSAPNTPTVQKSAARPRPVFSMQHNERMAGSVPVWSNKSTVSNSAVQALDVAARSDDPASQANSNDFDQALGYANAGGKHESAQPEPFGFKDLIDIVNPLQHIPLVNIAYRSITGDEIKPSTRILGGALYGGFAGAAGSLVNVIAEHETGKDVAGNVMAALVDGQKPHYRSVTDNPEARLNSVAQTAPMQNSAAREQLPASLLAFTDSGAPANKARLPSKPEHSGPPPQKRYYTGFDDEPRMAGIQPETRVLAQISALPAHPREPITQLALNDMPTERGSAYPYPVND